MFKEQKINISRKRLHGRMAKVQDNPPIMYGIRSPITLISKLYCCFRGYKEIVAFDPDILKQLLDAYIDFYTSHKSGVTKQLLQLCEQLLDKRLSLNSTAELSKQRYGQTYEENKLRFWLDTQLKKGSLLKVSKQKYLEGMSWPVPSATLNPNAFANSCTFERFVSRVLSTLSLSSSSSQLVLTGRRSLIND